MKVGAFDYVQKPFEIEEMEVKIEKALEMRRLKNELEYLRGTQQDIYDFDRIVGSSAALQKVPDIVKKVAKSNTTVLVRGETGTGKELIAGATPALVEALGEADGWTRYRLALPAASWPDGQPCPPPPQWTSTAR